MRTLYLLLNLPLDASTEQIRLGKKRLLGQLHPDKHPGLEHTDAAFKAVDKLIDVLLDPCRRDLYNEFGDAGLEPGFDPEIAREASRLAASGIAATSIRRVVVDASEASRGTFVEVDVQRRVGCAACAGYGYTTRACAACTGRGGVAGHTVVACDCCQGLGLVATQYGIRSCPKCGGSRAIPVRTVYPCSACTAGHVLGPCATCDGVGYGFRLVPVRVTVPPGTKHGTLLRLAGQLEGGPHEAANDLYLQVLVAG